jgi:hypothetical protein
MALFPHAAVVAVLGVLAAGWGNAAEADVQQALGKRASVDWTRGLLLAVGAAAGDLRAPTPQIARVAAERRARTAARARLRELADRLPLAGGGTVATRLDSDADAKERVARAVENAITVDLDYGSDGSTVATLGLPLEAVRVALDGALAPPTAAQGSELTALVVNASEVMSKPALAVTLSAGGERYEGPAVFFFSSRAIDLSASDPRLGGHAEATSARAYAQGVLELADNALLARARTSAALVVILLGKGKE